MTPILECNAVTKGYARDSFFSRSSPLPVLTGVNFSMMEGESIGLLGKNGCGKSTLSRLILDLEKPDGGHISYQGIQTDKMTKKETIRFRKEVQVVFQDSHSAVNGRLTVSRILAEPLNNFYSLSGEALRKRIAELLEMVGLSAESAMKYPHQFSGGQLQRVCIARALSTDPSLLVLDESVNSLDMAVQTQTLKLLAKLKKERGLTCILISHDLRAVFHLCDRILIMSDGKIVEELERKNGYNAGRHPVYRELLNAIHRRKGGHVEH
jgi:nickel import ATP-binding protein NikE